MKRVFCLIGLVLFLASTAYAETNNYEVTSVTPNIETSAYADGDLIGEILTVDVDADYTSVKTAEIKAVTLVDKDTESAAVRVWFFSADLDDGTYTDNAAFDLHDDDAAGYICKVEISSYTSGTSSSVGDKTASDCIFRANSGQIYAAIVANGTTPTYTAATDLILKVKFSQ